MIMLLMVVRGRRGQRQFNPEAAALPWRAAGLDAPVVGGADGFDDRQAQARPAQFTRTRLINSEEPVENPRQRFRRNPHAIIRNLQHRLVIEGADAQSNGSALESVFDRIVEQVYHHLLNRAWSPSTQTGSTAAHVTWMFLSSASSDI